MGKLRDQVQRSSPDQFPRRICIILSDPILAGSIGLVGLILGAGGAGLIARRWMARRTDRLSGQIAAVDQRLKQVGAATHAFESALILIDDSRPSLVAGEAGLAGCAALLGAPPRPAAFIDALATLDPVYERGLEALFLRGAPLRFEVVRPMGVVLVEGRAAGAYAWLRLTLNPFASAAKVVAKAPPSRLAALIDVYRDPAWITEADGAPVWVNPAWLASVEADSLADARARGLSIDRGADALARGAASSGVAGERVRWTNLAGRRRALLVRAAPLAGGGVGVWTQDVTQAESAAETLRRHVAAHDLTLNQIADAVVFFNRDRRITFHNAVFARLWDLEPAWLAEQPSHAEFLDRLRQRRRLPETPDYGRFKGAELARYEQVAEMAEEIWRLPDGRTLRVVGQSHPLGGLIMVFSDITPELRLKTQFNHLIQVQQATLDKLTDAVAVFGADGRMTLHNEAFQRFWSLTESELAESPDFDGVVELCVRRVHDLQFWRNQKGRITNPDPQARAAATGELTASDDRIIAWQSRPLPDGATLLGFADVTDTRRLEGALRDREAALREAERLKREFVGSVSYELRTPLTTILGYSELLERDDAGLSDRARGYVGSISSAATRLARSINDILDVAQIDAGDLTLKMRGVPATGLLAAAATRWGDAARRARVELALGETVAVAVIRGDEQRLGQALDHLIENAIRHTPVGGVVTLSVRQAPGEIRLQVADTGRGIQFDAQAHIFDRFSGQEQGAPGLGLALVKAIIELHGGWVDLESEPGVGAAFTCHLPDAGKSDLLDELDTRWEADR